MVEVAAAANESATNGSSAWCPPVRIHSSCGERVLGDEHAREPGPLGALRHLGDRVGRDELPPRRDIVGRQPQMKLHGGRVTVR